MKLNLCFILLFLLPNFVASQPFISGQITDAHTQQPLMGVHIYLISSTTGAVSDQNGYYQIPCSSFTCRLQFLYPGFAQQTIRVSQSDTLHVQLFPQASELVQFDTVIAFDPETYEERIQVVRRDQYGNYSKPQQHSFLHDMNPNAMGQTQVDQHNTNDFSPIDENGDRQVLDEPLSTFSIDVDHASYSIVRSHIHNKQPVPKDAVRVEELINYFDYDYPQPKKGVPFSISTEIADCPWNPTRKLLHLGLQGQDLDYEELPPSQLVFLLDVSGSMKRANKLPLLKTAFKLLVEKLRPEDKVAIVVYAGAAGVVLEPTLGNQKDKILAAIDQLHAGGSTAGGAGIQLAYKLAKEHFLPNGNNRIILATDGDFNVGVSSDGELTRLIEEKRKEHIFLTVLGFGMGNFKDNKLELLADKGNGQYAYIDNEREARKVFIHQLRGNLFTIAKDVKIQIEFNPYLVKSYRLIGYENRLLNKEDFKDDAKDAGELGVGHTVTALYELVLEDAQGADQSINSKNEIPLLYQKRIFTKKAKKGKALGQISFRYKLPKATKSKFIKQKLSSKLLNNDTTSDNFRFAAAVAGFGMILRESTYNKGLDLAKVKGLAKSALGEDPHGYRESFLDLVDKF